MSIIISGKLFKIGLMSHLIPSVSILGFLSLVKVAEAAPKKTCFIMATDLDRSFFMYFEVKDTGLNFLPCTEPFFVPGEYFRGAVRSGI